MNYSFFTLRNTLLMNDIDLQQMYIGTFHNLFIHTYRSYIHHIILEKRKIPKESLANGI